MKDIVTRADMIIKLHQIIEDAKEADEVHYLGVVSKTSTNKITVLTCEDGLESLLSDHLGYALDKIIMSKNT